jgi:2-polyprenyl-6-methoxyphenol hydroxylase-like FAD-dependent oxidoreductase
LGIDALGRVGLAERVRALGSVMLTRTALHAADGTSVEIELPGEMWGVSRMALDAALLEAARETGARVVQPARCEGLNGSISVRDLASNVVEEFEADWTLLADGKAGLLAARPMPTGDLGIKAHFDQVDGPRDAIELFGLNGHYVGVAPIEGGRWNLAMSIPLGKLRKLGGGDGMWAELIAENSVLAGRFRHARRVSPWLSSPLPRFGVVRDWPERVIPLGNAAAALEPIGGEGMGLAMQSAVLAAAALEQWRDGGSSFDFRRRLVGRFDRLWRARRAGCRALARVLSSPRLAPAALDWARASESLTRAVTVWMGKSAAAL